MNIIVQKFGGTSLTTTESRKKAADKILEKVKQGYFPVVVVSAMGRKGDPYATDTLISLVKEVNEKYSLRDLDLIMSCGETISAVLLSTLLNSLGCKAVAVTGGQAGIITRDNFGNGEIMKVSVEKLQDIIKAEIIPIVTGFQGVTEKGLITTLGRGGSDVTATLLGAALGAEFVEIYTDVDGIMTADPRIVPEARLIETIDYNEVFQFAEHGAKVIHPRAVEYAMRGNVPVVVKNTYSNCVGTKITVTKDTMIHYNHVNKFITGIAHIPDRIQVTIEYKQDQDCFELDKLILDRIAQEDISIDMINFLKTQKIFITSRDNKEKINKILEKIEVSFSITDNCCKITIIGNRITGVPGIMSKIVQVLYDNKIPILQTADSHTTISCLINEKHTKDAVNLLHDHFCL